MKASLTTPSMFGDPPRDDVVWSYPKYETFRQLQRVFEDTAVYKSRPFNLSRGSEPEQVRGEIVGASYFHVLGVQPELGRTFLPEEDRTANTHFVVILSDPLWRRRFGANPQVLGMAVNIDLKNYTIVGVMPARFEPLSGQADIWIPAHTLKADELSQPQSHSWDVIARLKSRDERRASEERSRRYRETNRGSPPGSRFQRMGSYRPHTERSQGRSRGAEIDSRIICGRWACVTDRVR
jgi:hypothetical protein